MAVGLLAGMPAPVSAAEPADLELLAEGFDGPVNFYYRPENDRTYVIEQYTGLVRVVENGEVLATPLIGIEDRLGEGLETEEGLVGIAFSPNGQRLYLAYAPHGGPLTLSRFTLSDDGTEAIESSEERIYTIDRHVAWHHCGHIAFGPDGFLYLCMGDSDDQGNPRNTAQDLSIPNGSIVRLDVEGGELPYAVPPDNPFTGTPGAAPEIWMYGLRNPWRFSIDAQSGHVVIPDVGWDGWEEINVMPMRHAGANFGWPFAEGNACIAFDPADCTDESFVWPVWEYSHTQPDRTCSVIGGDVYRGTRFPEWRGVYVFGDYCAGKIWAIRNIFGAEPEIRTLVSAEIGPSSIGHGRDGDIVLTDIIGGNLYRLNFPSDFESGWRSLGEARDEAVTLVRRSAGERGRAWMSQILPEQRLIEWYDAIGRPAAWQIAIVIAVVALLLLGGLIALLWANARLKALSRGPR